MSFYLKKAGQCLTVDLPFMCTLQNRVRAVAQSELLPRVELGTSSLPRMRSTTELKQHKSGKRDSNPRPPAWKASALSTELFPRDFLAGKSRASFGFAKLRMQAFTCLAQNFRKKSPRDCVGADGFEPPKSKDSRFTVCPIWPLWNTPSSESACNDCVTT